MQLVEITLDKDRGNEAAAVEEEEDLVRYEWKEE